MDIEKWQGQDLLSEDELACLCCGVDPKGNRAAHLIEINDASEAIKRAVLAKALNVICPTDANAGDKLYGHARFFRTWEAAIWAQKKFAKFPALCFDNDLSQSLDDKPLDTRERYSLLTIIAAFCKLQNIDISRASKAAVVIESLTDTLGAPVAKRTIEGHLKRIPEALSARMK